MYFKERLLDFVGGPDKPLSDFPLTKGQVLAGLERVIEVEEATREPEGLWDTQILDRASRHTLEPVLRTKFDRKLAREVINSFITFTVGAVAGVLGEHWAIDIGAALLMGYGSRNMNYFLHQHNHVRLTNSKGWNTALDYYMSLTVGMTAWHWRIQHVLGHHGHGKHQQFGELEESDYEIDRRTIKGFWTALLKHDVPRMGDVLIRPVLYMGKEALKGEKGIKDVVPEEKVEALKTLLRNSGATEEVVENLVFDTQIEVKYLQDLISIAGVWAAIGFLVASNLFLAPYYIGIQIFTKCTDFMNHSRPDGSGKSNGMNNLYEKLAHNVPGFPAHSWHHLYSWVHPEVGAIQTKKMVQDNQIDDRDFEKSGVQPGADSKVLVRATTRGIARYVLSACVKATGLK